MNEVVKYHNDLNNISLGGFSETQMNILFTIFAKIKESNTDEVRLSMSEIVELANIQTSNKRQLNSTIFRAFQIMQGLTFRWADDEGEGQSVAFYEIVKRHDNDELIVKINPKFSYLFNSLMSNFTRFELAEFVSLNSKYAKTLYRLLKQYRRTGYLKISWDKFIDIMDIPKSYTRIQDIEKDILKSCIKKLSSELNLFDQKRTPFKKLKMSKKKTKGQGNKITHVEFTFTPENLLIDAEPNKFQKYIGKKINTKEGVKIISFIEDLHDMLKVYFTDNEHAKIKDQEQLDLAILS